MMTKILLGLERIDILQDIRTVRGQIEALIHADIEEARKQLTIDDYLDELENLRHAYSQNIVALRDAR